MATSVVIPEGQYEFLVVIPDKPGMREKRLEVRGVPKNDKPESLDFFGSAFVVVAESVEQVRSQFSKDIYATAGVWDMNKVM
ncbi:hypothetical protein NW762_006175 [Fusarium torreyae]|uniref:YCII-related domain-containing protein n=1 Tax=Fusarium torreyae TaxID=1237075 RepID=A0A9W8S2E3_9HYPO|nr:hypothetical protein NW762_006175 [Fusarium torreyae]